MAFTKQEKTQMVARYVQWIRSSQAMIVLSFNKMNMKEIDNLRAKVREAGGELHVVKNTLVKLALQEVGYPTDGLFEGSSLVGFAFQDAPALAKVLNEATRNSEIFALKGGYLGARRITAEQVKALAELPPLPVMRAQLLGVLQAPAAKLVRTLAEPARALAAVVKAYSEKGATPAAA